MKRQLFSSRPLNLDFGLLLLRVFTAGFMIYGHGWPKVQRMLAGNLKFADPIGLGEELSFFLMIFAEVICSVLIIIGYITRPAVITLLFGMGVVVFVVHSGDSFFDKEHILLYLVNFGVLLFTGPGKYSVDGRR